ncbi:MAG: Crp/Fnr family transcriptional regulator [Myxococcaceae bacterium]
MSPPNSALEQFIRGIPLFVWVAPEEMLDILRLLRPVQLEAGQVLFRQGDPGTALWVLGQGTEVSISATSDASQRPVVLASAHSGETVGEMALVDDGSRSATAVVMQGGTAYQIDAVDFHTLREANHAAAYKVLRRICTDLCGRLRATNERIAPTSNASGAGPGELPSRAATIAEVEAYPPFKAFPEVARIALAQKLRAVQLDAIRPVFAEGDAADAAYFVLEGEVTVGRNGRTLATLGPGQLIGLVGCLDKGTRSASAITAAPTTLLRLASRDFDWLVTQGNRVTFRLIDLVTRQLVTHLRQSNKRVPLVTPSGFTPLPPPPQLEPALLPLDLELDLP